jgi:hypothetical protein
MLKTSIATRWLKAHLASMVPLVAMDVFSIYGQDFTHETHVVIIIHTIV